MSRQRKTNAEIVTNYVVTESGCCAYLGNFGKPILHRRPTIKNGGKSTSLARYIYGLIYGPIPEGLIVRHKCDIDWCVNPEHLELGTHLDNSRDMVERGRSLKGSKNNHSKLDEPTVFAMRSEWIPRIVSIPKLAKKYNISVTTASRTINGKGWNHVNGSRYEPKGEQCANGHNLTTENTHTRKNGRIECKQCRIDWLVQHKDKVTKQHRLAHNRRMLKGSSKDEIIYCKCGVGFKSPRSLTLHKSHGKCQLLEKEQP